MLYNELENNNHPLSYDEGWYHPYLKEEFIELVERQYKIKLTAVPGRNDCIIRSRDDDGAIWVEFFTHAIVIWQEIWTLEAGDWEQNCICDTRNPHEAADSLAKFLTPPVQS